MFRGRTLEGDWVVESLKSVCNVSRWEEIESKEGGHCGVTWRVYFSPSVAPASLCFLGCHDLNTFTIWYSFASLLLPWASPAMDWICETQQTSPPLSSDSSILICQQRESIKDTSLSSVKKSGRKQFTQMCKQVKRDGQSEAYIPMLRVSNNRSSSEQVWDFLWKLPHRR